MEGVKRKRGRPRKSSIPAPPPLPLVTIPIEVPSQSGDLENAQKLLKSIMELHRIGPFLEKPDASSFGLHNYYRIIKKPMWLREICRKLSCGEYKDITGLVKDVRQMLENCYTYWGPNHRITRIGFQVENVLEKSIKTLPESMQAALKLEDSITNGHGDPLVKTNSGVLDPTKCEGSLSVPRFNEISAGSSNPGPSTSCGSHYGAGPSSTSMDYIPVDDVFSEDQPLRKGFESKILSLVLKKGINHDEFKAPDIDNVDDLIKWEKETLCLEQLPITIDSIWQLVSIGQFLKLSHKTIDLDDVTQYEVERMLLMPQKSFTLACIMTSMLCPRFLRTHLFSSPIMCYKVWNQLLRNKLELWYKIYYTQQSLSKVLDKCGIEFHFWAAVGDVNPMGERDFHELELFQRVWIVHSLCSYVFNSVKILEDSFNSMESDDLRGIKLGNDGKYEYICLFAPEIRIYKQIIETSLNAYFPPFSKSKKSSSNHPLKDYFSEVFDKSGYLPPPYVYPDKDTFCLVAYDRTTLEQFKATIGNQEILDNLSKIDFSKHGDYSLHALYSIRNQYTESINDDPGFVSKSIDYWISKNRAPFINSSLSPDREPKDILFGNGIGGHGPNLELLFSLGKRQRKKRFLEDSIFEEVSADEKSDVSDWETDNNIRRSKRIKRSKEVKKSGGDEGGTRKKKIMTMGGGQQQKQQQQKQLQLQQQQKQLQLQMQQQQYLQQQQLQLHQHHQKEMMMMMGAGPGGMMMMPSTAAAAAMVHQQQQQMAAAVAAAAAAAHHQRLAQQMAFPSHHSFHMSQSSSGDLSDVEALIRRFGCGFQEEPILPYPAQRSSTPDLSDASTQSCDSPESQRSKPLDSSVMPLGLMIRRGVVPARSTVLSAAIEENARRQHPSSSISSEGEREALTISVKPENSVTITFSPPAEQGPILTRGLRPDGSYGFFLVLPDKRVIPLTDQAAHQMTLID